MAVPGARYVPLLALATLTATLAVLLFGPGPRPASPARTDEVAALTFGPVASVRPLPPSLGPAASPPPGVPRASGDPGGVPGAGPPVHPALPPGPTAPPTRPATPATGIVPGSVDRTSLELVATYDVNAAITTRTGVLDVATTITVRNSGTKSIDRLELNTIAARLGRLRVTSATVDGTTVKARVRDQTLIVPFGGVLQPGASTTVLVAYRARLANSISNSDWMFSRYRGTLALYRWIPWISRSMPFDRPNAGDPFVTASSPEVSVEILTDAPLRLVSPAKDVAIFEAGSGTAWAFTLRDVRDVAIVLAPSFAMVQEKVGEVTVRAYARSGSFAAKRLLSLTTRALREQARLLDVDYPWPMLVAVETEGGEALESPGVIWVPRSLDTLNRTYMVHHAVGHQWFYGIVGSDGRNQPFADEAAADFLARTVLGTFRSSRCSRTALDGPLARYAGRCYYEVMFVQGGLFLEDVRLRMGSNRFWNALRDYLGTHRFGVASTRDLLDALQERSEVNLRSLFRERFPTLY